MPRKAHFSDHDFVVVKHVQVNSAAQALQFNGAFDASAAKLVIADPPAKVVALLQPFLDSKILLILILTPILMLLVNAAGIDPIYFGVLFVINNSIGLITPPVGVVLNVVAGVTRTSMEDVMKGVWPFLVSELFVLRQTLARCDRLCQWHNSAVPFSAIRILGIDPGLNRTGYGVVEVNGSRLAFIAAGVIRVPAGDLHQRLGTILRSLAAVIRDTQPQVATIEKVFVNVNPQSTLLLGQARGAAICAAVAEGLVVHEYAALRIKQAVVGFGRADKRQVQAMVQRLLSLERAPTSDAADALACAICHAHSASLLMALRSKASIAPRVRSTANGRRAWTARLQGLE